MHDERMRTSASADSDWRTRGACRGHDPELFFPDGDDPSALVQAGTAKAVCQSCPVAGACLAWSLNTRQSFGVWGGLTHEERRSVLAVRALTALAARATTDHSPAAERPIEAPATEAQVLVGGGRRA